MDNHISDEVRRLLAGGVSSMDHVDLLFHLGDRESTMHELAAATRFDRRLIGALTIDLQKAGLVTCRGQVVRLTDEVNDRKAVAELLRVYNARPVTLVRAIYARESLSQRVADALNPRPGE